MAVPPLIVALPFSGFSLQYDEVKLFVSTANSIRGNPLRAAEHSLRDIDRFLDLGTFRPLGRFLENGVYSAMFETSEATGLAPHALQGVIRLVMVAALAHAAVRVVAALMRSAGVRSDHPALLVYPMVLAITLVANGSVSPLVLFPLLFTGSAVFVLAVVLVVARDRDMQPRRLHRYEPGVMALLGAAAAMTYDLVYVAPILAAVFIVSRATAARMTVSEMLRLAAARRWMYLSLGFLVVFVPARIVIAVRCSQAACYEATNVSLSVDALELVPGRLLTGAPPAGWHHNSDLGQASMQFDLVALAANALMALLLLAAVAWIALVAGRTAQWPDHDEASDGGPPRWGRLGMALLMVGAAAAVLAAILISLARFNQQRGLSVGQPWRDTVLVQFGWSLLIFAGAVLVVRWFRSRGARRTAFEAIVALLGTCLVVTLFFNWRLATVEGRTPRSTVTKQMLIAATSNDATDQGNTYRCELIETFEELAFSMEGLLDEMMLDRYGMAFCDPERTPGRE